MLQWCTAILPDWSQPHPLRAGLPQNPMMGGGDASAVSYAETGPAREPRDLSEGHNWTRQGTDGFLGHTACQGQTVGSSASRHGLDPDGCVVRHHVADTKSTKTGMRLQPHVGGWSRSSRAQRQKSWPTLCRGDVWPLDESLLMGVSHYSWVRYPAPDARCASTDNAPERSKSGHP